MNVRVISPEVDVTYRCGKPQGTPRGTFSRFLHELGIDRCTVLLGDAMKRMPGVLASPPGNEFVEGGKKG